MSKTDKDKPPEQGGKWAMWKKMYADKHAPSSWKRAERKSERNKAAQALRNDREPSRYRRPYYW